jgi:hypothetical protein
MCAISMALESSGDVGHSFETIDELLEHCYSIVAHYLSRLEEWDRRHICDLTHGNDEAPSDFERFRRRCFQMLGVMGNSVSTPEDFDKQPTAKDITRVTEPLIKLLKDFRNYLWGQLECDFSGDLSTECRVDIESNGEPYVLACKDIVGTSLVINLLQHLCMSPG